MRRLAALVVALVAVAGCGVPTDSTPRDLAAERLPDGLLAEPPSTTTTLPAHEGDLVPLTVYLLDGEVPLLRQTARSAPDDSPSQMLEELQRLTPADEELGHRTLITPDVNIVRPTVSFETTAGDTLRLALSDEFYELEGQNRSLAAAQLVFTITATNRFDAVLFVDGDDEPRPIPTSDGELPEQPRAMTRADFDRFNPLILPNE